MAEVCTLSGRVSPRRRGPIRPITGRPSLAPPFLYPLRHPLPCGRDTAASRDGTSGAYPVVQCGEADGEAASYSPAGHGATVVEASNRRSDPHALLAPACQHLWPVPMTDLNHGRSLAFSLPSSAGPPPDWCFQIVGRCPRSFTRRIAPSHVRVAALGWTRFPHGTLHH
jgi:hypothetical protein